MANSNQNISTPWSFFHAVERYYDIQFNYDIAADAKNTKCSRFLSENDNSLERDWPLSSWCWVNPPFRHVGKWIQKCKEQSDKGCKIISVWPLSGDLNAIDAWKESRVTVVHGRVWPEVRGVMLCEWVAGLPVVHGARWDKKELVTIW